MKTLEKILESEKKNRVEDGAFGIKACKESIINIKINLQNKSLYQVLEEYVERANKDIMFNKRMILACWELIGNK